MKKPAMQQLQLSTARLLAKLRCMATIALVLPGPLVAAKLGRAVRPAMASRRSPIPHLSPLTGPHSSNRWIAFWVFE